jgi:putative glutamine amidotransferase
MMSRRRRIMIVAAILVCMPLVAILAYGLWRSPPPEGGPKIGLSMASVFVVQRPLYEDALARAGGRATVLTPTEDPARINKMLDGIDGLLLTGGGDIAPELYRGDSDGAAGAARRRDDFEIRLIQGAVSRGMPVLGICRGIQILNVAHGGTIRDLRTEEKLSDRHNIGLNSFAAHEVDVVAESRLAEVVGAGRHSVNSFHGQAIDEVGDGLKACAVADDGVIEGVERPDCTFVIGIQWHPEIASLTDETALALFEALVRHANAYAADREVRSAAPATTE